MQQTTIERIETELCALRKRMNELESLKKDLIDSESKQNRKEDMLKIRADPIKALASLIQQMNQENDNEYEYLWTSIYHALTNLQDRMETIEAKK